MTPAGPSLYQAYAASLRIHAHCLIAEGYARMDRAAFACAQEPVITGELVREMRAHLESADNASGWACYYAIHEDPPLNVEGRLGTARPRVDIEIMRISPGPRPRLPFEAKRLSASTGHNVSGYLGADGLGCFISGRYPMTHDEAGMLGYVQSDSEEIWAERIATALRGKKECRAVDPRFAHQGIHASLRHTYLSRHLRSKGTAFAVHHVLLRFG